MEEQASWKGQSFTLLVFGGIVFLCSIFFVLGMLVGRGQGQRSAETASATAAAKVAAAEAKSAQARSNDEIEKSELTGNDTDTVKAPSATPSPLSVAARAPQPIKSDPPAAVSETKPTPKTTPAAPPKPEPAAAPAVSAAVPSATKMIYLQVDALEKSTAANKEVDELRKKGFPALIASGEGANKLYRVQVGPFSNAADADTARHKLEGMGYKPIKK